MSKFYRSEVSFVVLSEEPVDDVDLGTILEACDSGPMLLHSTGFNVHTLNPKQMADALSEAGSDPGFFGLDADGLTCV